MEQASPFRRSRLPWILDFAGSLVAQMLYRVHATGETRLPAAGGVLLVSNHLSYMDAVVLQLACPRPIRFVGSEQLKRNVFVRWIFKLSGTITFSPRAPHAGTREVVEALRSGEVVCLFPEGAISRGGQLLELRRPFEKMARQANVPVVPVAHDGLWGSIFSYSENKYLFKSPRLMPTPVAVCFGAPIPPGEVTTARVRTALLDLGCEAFNQRPVLKRHLGFEVVRALAKHPFHLAIVDRTTERREISSGRLLGVAAALSKRLKNTIRGRRVGIVLPPGIGVSIANLAVVCAGKIPVNMNFTAGRTSLEKSLQLGEIDTVISADAVRAKVPNFPWPKNTLDLREEILAAGKPSIIAWTILGILLPNQIVPRLLGLPKRGDGDEAALLFTSGSSGEPKGVVLTHRNILANCWQISSLSILPDTAKILACLPMFHSFGFTVTLWYPMIRGCRTVTVPSPLDTKKIIDAIREEEVSVMIGAPTFLRPLLKKAESADLKSLELLVSGAEKMPLDLHDAFHRRFNVEIMQGYGLTETTPVTNVNQPDPPQLSELAEPQPGKRLGSVGRMMPGMTARIVDPDTLESRQMTETGMLLFKGANVFTGYLKDPGKTAQALRDGWFVTGDLARFDHAGFLFIEGRLSRFSKIGGEMVPHGTVEQKIVESFGWEQNDVPVLVVVGVPDASKGEALVLVTTMEVSLDEVREKLTSAGLPNLWVPKVIVKTEKIPLLGTGKLDLKASRELALAALTPVTS